MIHILFVKMWVNTMKFLVLCATLIVSTNAQSYSHGACDPEIGTYRDFNFEKFVGEWYLIKRSYIAFEEGTKCYKTLFQSNNDGTFNITDSFVALNESKAVAYGACLLGERRVDTERQELHYNAYGTESDLSRGKLHVIPGLTEAFDIAWILDTDYENYAVTYSCTNVHQGKVEFAWIITRVKRPEKSFILKGREALHNKKIRLALVNVDQTCDY